MRDVHCIVGKLTKPSFLLLLSNYWEMANSVSVHVATQRTAVSEPGSSSADHTREVVPLEYFFWTCYIIKTVLFTLILFV